jgi:hypothetical protein
VEQSGQMINSAWFSTRLKKKSLSSLGATQISSWGTDRSEICHLPPPFQYSEQGVCHTVALPFTLKSILKQREEFLKLKFFTMQKYNLQNNPLKKKSKILENIFHVTKFQHKPKYHLSKILI